MHHHSLLNPAKGKRTMIAKTCHFIHTREIETN
jgi:hypothetical protein